MADQPNARLMQVAAVMTWLAAFFSEWFQLRGADAWVFSGFAIAFIGAFLWMSEKPPGRGHPALLTVATVGAAGAVWVGGFGLTPALYVILGTQLYLRLPRRLFWFALIALNAWLYLRLSLNGEYAWAFAGLIAYGGFQLFGLLMAANAEALSEANLKLTSSNAELLGARALLSDGVRANERLKLSRELHDLCGHKLTALKLTLRQVPINGVLDGDALKLTRRLTDELLDDIRSVVSTLRAHDGVDLGQALAAMANGWQAPRVSLAIDPELPAPRLELAHALLRVAQEAVTNAARHGAANEVAIRLSVDGDAGVLRVDDDGVGRPPFSEGNGLGGMRERLLEAGAALKIEPRAPRGVSLRAAWPLNAVSLTP
jgi:signal transduction histidine kinase